MLRRWRESLCVWSARQRCDLNLAWATPKGNAEIENAAPLARKPLGLVGPPRVRSQLSLGNAQGNPDIENAAPLARKPLRLVGPPGVRSQLSLGNAPEES